MSVQKQINAFYIDFNEENSFDFQIFQILTIHKLVKFGNWGSTLLD